MSGRIVAVESSGFTLGNFMVRSLLAMDIRTREG
jgi:hypothetical protein